MQVPKHSSSVSWASQAPEEVGMWAVSQLAGQAQKQGLPGLTLWVRGNNTYLDFHLCAWTHGPVLPPGRFSNVSCNTSPWLREFTVISASLHLVHQPQRTLLWTCVAAAKLYLVSPSQCSFDALEPQIQPKKFRACIKAAMARNPCELLVGNGLHRSFPCRAGLAKLVFAVWYCVIGSESCFLSYAWVWTSFQATDHSWRAVA